MTRLAELPFVERPALAVFDLERGTADPEYAGFGWTRLDRLWLTSEGRAPRELRDVLVIAAHARDEATPQSDDIELAFELAPDRVAVVGANDFLAAWLPRLPQDASAIVLAICNPHDATLALPPDASRAPVYYATGDVTSWLEIERDRVQLAARSWRTLSPVSTALTRRPLLDDETKNRYAGIYLLKKMDLKPKDGGMEFPIKLPTDLSPLEDVLHQLVIDGYAEMNTRKSRYDLTKAGIDYLGRLIDEAGDMIDEFDEDEMEDVIRELRARRIDPLRARFLWGWYDGEFDDLVIWQEQRGVQPVERMWSLYLLSDEFWAELADEVAAAGPS